MQLFIFLAALIGIMCVAFAMQNLAPVTVALLYWRFDSSLAMVLLVAFALGALVVGLATTPQAVRRQWAFHRQQKRIHELESKQAQLTGEISALTSRLPEALDAAGEPLPYVGLTQIFSSRENAP